MTPAASLAASGRRILGRFGSERDQSAEHLEAYRKNLKAGIRYYLERASTFGLVPWLDELQRVYETLSDAVMA